MPKKLNISSNERVDLEDFNRASAEYTQESDNFERQKLFQARRSLVASGFRIEISDQTTSPGQFTIYNGLSLDRSGNILNNEQQVSDARTLTLSGGGTSFYIEVEFVEGESDVDTRAFWDPTFSGNTPPGKEFSLNVATRVTPNWQIVSPVSTSGFDVDITDINSVKVPIAVLTTDGANQIVGFTAQNASTVLEEDVLSAVTEVRVLDSTLFPINLGSATLDLGGANPETVSIVGNDLVNGIITFAGPTSFAHNAGAILRETVVAASFVPESKLAAPSADEDRRRRMYAGDETRGGALAQDSQNIAARSDLAISNLKDHVDFLAAQIREMKFGTSRVGETTYPAPSIDPASRYYDYAGNISAARPFSYTIGDASLSIGDYNSTSDDLGTVIQAAHDVLDGTKGGSLLVKEGVYVWDATVTVNRPLRLVFAEGVTFEAGTYASAPLSLAAAVRVEIVGMPAVPSSELPFPVTATNVDGIELVVVNSTLQVDYTAATLVNTSSFDFTNCVFPVDSSAGAFKTNDGTSEFFSKMLFRGCLFQYIDSVDLTTEAMVDVQLSNASFEDCVFDIASGTGSANQILDVKDTNSELAGTFTRCQFIESAATIGNAKGPIRIASSGIVFRECTFDVSWGSTTVSNIEKSFVFLSDGVDVEFYACVFDNFEVLDSAETNETTWGACIRFDSGGTLTARDCYFQSANNDSYDIAVVGEGIVRVGMSNNGIFGFYRSIYVEATNKCIIADNEILTGAYTGVLAEIISIEVGSSVAILGHGGSISGNYISHTSSGSGVAFEYTAIKVNEFDGETSPINVENNVIVMEPFSGEKHIGIDLPVFGKLNGADRMKITGNDIHIPSQSYSGTGDKWGIRGHQLFSTTYSSANMLVSNNNISIRDNTGGGNNYGMDFLRADDNEPFNYSTGLTITSNNVSVAAPTNGHAIGINYIGVLATISNNNISITNGTTSIPASGCIYGFGHWINIQGNNCQLAGGTRGVIRADIGDDDAFAVDATGNINISNNMLNYSTTGTSGGAIGIFNSSTGNGDVRNLNIVNNTVHASPADANSVDLVWIISNGAGGCFSISGNSIYEEDPPSAGSNRSAISISCTTASHDTISINNNLVSSRNHVYVNVLRGTNSSAIHFQGDDVTEGITVNGNCIYNWIGNGASANRRSIDVNDVFGFTVSNNVCQATGTAGEPVIRVDSSTNGCVAGNEADDYNISTSGSVDVVTTGSNNGNII